MSELAVGFRSLPEEFQNIIRAAQDLHKIAVTPLQTLTGGLSGASIFLVSVASSNPERVEHYILKLDKKSEKSRSDEIVRYQSAISHSPADFADRHIAKMAFDRTEQDAVIAIFYSVAGQSLNQFRTLSTYEKQSQLETIFAATYKYVLDGWNAGRTFSQAVHPMALLEQWLGFRIKPGNQIENFIQTTCRLQPEIPGFLIQGSVFPNPMAYARNLALWGMARPIDAATGLQHGDLNTNNILVKFNRDDNDLEGYFLIDFAMFKEGMPLLYDLRYMEMSYLTLRQTQVSFGKLMDLIALFGEADRVDRNQVPIDVAGVCAVIGSARGTFERWVQDSHPSLHDDLWGQYWLAGVAAGLSYCHKSGLADEERLAGLVYAAANLKRYTALFGIPNPTECQQLFNPAGLGKDRPARSLITPARVETLHNLPTQSTPFIGRKTQVAAARDLILSDGVRLVTFTGPGGTGKTRLSLQVASEVLDQFSDGVFFVMVAETTDLNIAVSKIAQVLEVREGNSQSLINSLKDYLRDKSVLLIMDNFEQLVGAASMVADLLTTASKLKFLISSRIVLRIRGEHEFPVPPLETPDASNIPALELIQENESIQLFVQRAQSANPKFALTKENAAPVCRICQRLDGLPLAIELAAARIKLLSPQAMVAKLNDRLALLTGGARDMPTRQQTLRNTLDWSHGLLNAQEKKLFARLGIFVGGFNLEAAEAICTSNGDLDVMAGVESLLNNSLLRQEEGADGLTRFRMLETIREYAFEELTKLQELPTLQRVHALYYFQKVAGDVGPKLFSSEAMASLGWLETEHDNIRAALAWRKATGESFEFLPPMMLALAWFWYRRGYSSEGRAWTEELLAASQPGSLRRGGALLSSAVLALWQGDVKTAVAEGEECLAIFEHLEDERYLPMAMLNMGVIYINAGKDQAASPILEHASRFFHELGQTYLYAATLVHHGNVALGLGQPDEARKWLDKALTASREVGDDWVISFALNNFGEVARVLGDYSLARTYYEESEALLRVMGDKGDLARLIHNLGYIAQHEGDLDQAKKRFHESLTLFRKFANKRGVAECLMGLAGLNALQGQPQRAAQLLGAAEATLAESGAAWWPADRGEVKRNRADIRSRLDESTFKIEYEKGQKMSRDEMFAIAFDGNQ